MKVLVACEESQEVCKAFRALGHEAYSCDFEPCSGGHPEWHLQCDALELLKMRWDMILAFPPCTYLSNAGARHLFPKGKLNEERYLKGLAAKKFFMEFYNADCQKIAIENPVSSRIFEMPPHSQEIQPFQFGHPVQKKTRLWLKGLPPLIPTKIVKPECNCHEAGSWFTKGGTERQKNRSKTFSGIANAMAQQWGSERLLSGEIAPVKQEEHSQTNYVKITRMSMIEMTKFLESGACTHCVFREHAFCHKPNGYKCEDGIGKWLEQEEGKKNE